MNKTMKFHEKYSRRKTHKLQEGWIIRVPDIVFIIHDLEPVKAHARILKIVDLGDSKQVLLALLDHAEEHVLSDVWDYDQNINVVKNSMIPNADEMVAAQQLSAPTRIKWEISARYFVPMIKENER
jgi:hypothetical protein